MRSEEHTSELQSLRHLVCRLLLEKKKKNDRRQKMYVLKTFDLQSLRLIADEDPVPVGPLAHCLLDQFFFFFNDTATTEIYTLSLHDALPICAAYFLVRYRSEAFHRTAMQTKEA